VRAVFHKDGSSPISVRRRPEIRANAWLQTRGLPPGNNTEIARNFGSTLAHRDGREMLNERAQEALRLRFAEKKTYEEIAAELGVSTFLAQRIVTKAVAELRLLLRGGVRLGGRGAEVRG